MTTGIIVANASEAAFYEAEHPRSEKFLLIESFTHPKSRAKREDLLCDRPGHFQTDHSARSAFEKSDPKQVEAEKFCCELAHHAHEIWGSNKFDHVILVMPAHIHGFFMKHFKGGFSKIDHFSKDYTKLPINDLVKQIHEHLMK